MNAIYEKIKLLYNRILNAKYSLPVRNILLAVAVNLAVEMFARRSPAEGLVFMILSPLQFLYGVLVVLFTMSFGLLVKRRLFFKTLVCGLWVVGGIVNCIVTKFRHTPFTAQDFRLIKYAYTIAPVYLSTIEIFIIVIMIAAFIAGMIVWWCKAPVHTEKINYSRCLVVVLSFWFVVWGTTRIGVSLGLFARNFGNIGDAYNKYGFAYCFSNSLLNSGIDKPKDYSEDAINAILDKLETETPPNSTEAPNVVDETQQPEADGVQASEDYPNIIFVQLESLFDPQLLHGVEFSDTVLPTLNRLSRDYSSGFLSVPSVGAGTANTEFEVLSGMNLNDFGPGEYPYKTVLMRSACESICYYLKDYGYTTNALHNNDATFYDRNEVFSQLGFDTFTSIEYMNELQYNELGWADDSVLTGEIIGILNSSEERDFIYTISVQGHGDYPEHYEIKESDITATGETVEDYIQPFTYYVNQIHEMDEFVGELVWSLKKFGEPVVLVLYGDHLPAFDITDENLEGGNTYTTQYVIWNNIGITSKDEDLEAFQLGSYVLETLGMEGGAISRYHNAIRKSEDAESYLDGLKLLEYDILYGNKDVYDGVLPYSSTNLKMGYKEIVISSVDDAQGHVVITGKNFTEFSYVMINGEYVDTIFSNSEVLIVDGASINDGDTVAVVQKGADNVKLSSTSLYVYRSN